MVLLELAVHVTEPQQVGPPVMQVCPAWMHMAPIITQRPPWHTSGDMQSLLWVQAPFSAWRLHRPLRQVRVPQHWVSAVHAPASPRQQRVEPCACEHMVPLSHMP